MTTANEITVQEKIHNTLEALVELAQPVAMYPRFIPTKAQEQQLEVTYQHILSLLSQQRTELAEMVEKIKKPYLNEDFEDGGDEEYRERRERIEATERSSYNQALSDIIKIIINN